MLLSRVANEMQTTAITFLEHKHFSCKACTVSISIRVPNKFCFKRLTLEWLSLALDHVGWTAALYTSQHITSYWCYSSSIGALNFHFSLFFYFYEVATAHHHNVISFWHTKIIPVHTDSGRQTFWSNYLQNWGSSV